MCTWKFIQLLPRTGPATLLSLAVMEAETGADLVQWVRALGLTRLLNELSQDDQRAWENDLTFAVMDFDGQRRDVAALAAARK